MRLGAEPAGDGEVFNMAILGLRSAQRANGVSQLHGQVSRSMFRDLWPGFEVDEVPIGHITNGVHCPTWVNRDFAELYERTLGPDYARPDASWAPLGDVSDEDLWNVRRQARRRLVDEIRERLREVWLGRGASRHQLGWIDGAFDPEALTIGFARRVPSYKRLTLILRDPERLARLLTDHERPVQIVVAGKAHPADEGGKDLIRQFVEFASEPEFRHRIAFLPNYDMAMARYLVAGADVWLNNPLRPYEACGTSGMKSALNGGLNLSILDGWWDELYDGRNGWAIPSADDGTLDPEKRDEFEGRAIFDLLENEVVPMFYERSDGLPRRWIGMVRHAVSTLGPEVDAVRMLRDYVERLYVPAARGLTALAGNGGPGRPRRLEGARAQRLERRGGAQRRDGAGRRARRRAPGRARDRRAGRSHARRRRGGRGQRPRRRRRPAAGRHADAPGARRQQRRAGRLRVRGRDPAGAGGLVRLRRAGGAAPRRAGDAGRARAGGLGVGGHLYRASGGHFGSLARRGGAQGRVAAGQVGREGACRLGGVAAFDGLDQPRVVLGQAAHGVVGPDAGHEEQELGPQRGVGRREPLAARGVDDRAVDAVVGPCDVAPRLVLGHRGEHGERRAQTAEVGSALEGQREAALLEQRPVGEEVVAGRQRSAWPRRRRGWGSARRAPRA